MTDNNNVPPPQLWMIVGGNGAGKSTYFKRYLKPTGLPFINADVIAKSEFPDDPEGRSRDAARIAEMMRFRYLDNGISFCFETVFSHPSKIDFMAEAKAKGYQVIMVFIHLGDHDLNKARIAQRVAAGGHNVPDNKVEERIPRTLENVLIAAPLCDHVEILDNSSALQTYGRVLSIKDGTKIQHLDALPEWAIKF